MIKVIGALAPLRCFFHISLVVFPTIMHFLLWAGDKMKVLEQFLNENGHMPPLPSRLAKLFIAKSVKIKKKKQQQIITQADLTTDVYYIHSGKVEITLLSPDTKEFTFREVCSGNIFGELAAIDAQCRSVTVETITNCELFKMSRDVFLKVLREDTEFSEWLNLMLVRRIRNLTDKAFELSTMSVPCRIWLDLVRRATIQGIHNNQSLIADLPSHQKLAMRLGTHREAITREFGVLSKDGIIQKQPGKTMKILSISNLENLINRMMGG